MPLFLCRLRCRLAKGQLGLHLTDRTARMPANLWLSFQTFEMSVPYVKLGCRLGSWAKHSCPQDGPMMRGRIRLSVLASALVCLWRSAFVGPGASSRLRPRTVLAAEDVFQEGDRAMLTGFTERTSLNGEPVELLRWDEEKESWIVRRQSEQSITSLVSLKNLKPYEAKKSSAPAAAKEREFNPISFIASIIGGVIIVGTAVTVIVPLFLGLYKDMTGEFLVTLDVPSTI
ncbi:unnamed protein product [Effrenium voratum]|nr:unnamed protein product [Effrenium voratum]CAJ1462261.1 unnamed protein product [Effrenium voratum]